MQTYFRPQSVYELFALLVAFPTCCSSCVARELGDHCKSYHVALCSLESLKPRKGISGRHRRASDMSVKALSCLPGLCSSHSTVSEITDSHSHTSGHWVEQLASLSTFYFSCC